MKKQDKDKEVIKKNIPTRSICIPYVSGIAERMQRIFKEKGIGTYFKPYNTLSSNLVRPKDPTPPERQCGVVYQLKCKDCDESYIGETARSLKKRIAEHKRMSGTNITAVGEHLGVYNHELDPTETKIIAQRLEHMFPRRIREAIEIKMQKPKMNNQAGYPLPPIYNQLLSDPTGGSRDRKA